MCTLKPFLQLIFTGIILFFLAAQLTAVVIPVPSYYWPFTDYPMYSPPHFEGDAVKPTYTIIGIHSGDVEEVTTPEDFGLTVFQHQWWFVSSLLNNRDRQKVQTHIHLLQSDRSQPFEKLRVESHSYIISRSGYSPAPVEILKVIDLHEFQGANQ